MNKFNEEKENKNKEILELKKNNENLKKEKEKLQNEIIKILMKVKENFNGRNGIGSQKEITQINKLDSICSSIGGISAFSITEKE